MDPRNTQIEQNGHYHGFTVRRIEQTSYCGITYYELEHDATGARMIHLSMDDPNNGFMISFRTLPEDSTGVAHILEHSVLEGSRRFPVKIFKHLSGRSLNTFLNAMTGPDYTGYPFSSKNRKDYYNLMKLYLDAVFFPLLRRETFLQEGWRYEFSQPDNPDSPLEYKGVVFNEMKGAMSSPVRLFFEANKRAIYPDLVYRHVSGGDPAHIPDLTYEAWKDFHARHYHPSNAFIATAGDMPLLDTLELIQSFALAEFSRSTPPPPIPIQTNYPEPVTLRINYPVAAGAETRRKSIVAMSWKLLPIENFHENLQLSLLSMILTGDNTSYLMRKLLSSGLGAGPAPGDFDASCRESSYTVGLMDADEADTGKIETLILETLREAVNTGFAQDEVLAALHQMEFSIREIGGDHSIAFGLNLIFRGVSNWLNSGDFLSTLTINQSIERLRKEVESPDFFPGLIRKYLLDNPHRATVVLAPDPGGLERGETAERERLEQRRKSLTPGDIEAIAADSRILRDYQSRQEDTSCLPRIDIADISRDPDRISQTESGIDGSPLYLHTLETNDVDYLILGFPFPLDHGLPSQALALLDLIAELGAGGRDYVEFGTEINSWTGGIGLKTSPFRNVATGETLFSLSLSGRCLHRNFDRMISLMEMMMFSADFDDHRRIMELISTRKAYALPMAGYHGHRLAKVAAARKLSSIEAIHHRDNGLEYIRYLTGFRKSDLPALTQAIREALNHLLDRRRLHAGMTGTRLDESAITASLAPIITKLADSTGIDNLVESAPEPSLEPEAWVFDTGVSHVARVFPTVHEEHPDAPALTVLSDLMEKPLYSRIRARGGAYGAFASYNPETSLFSFMTYRDPHTARTLEAFREVIDEIGSGDFTDEQVTQAIVETIRKYDIPPSPREKGMIGMSRRLRGKTFAMRKRFREAILDTTSQDIQRVVETYLGPDASSSTAILTSDSILNNSETSGLNLKRIPLMDES